MRGERPSFSGRDNRRFRKTIPVLPSLLLSAVLSGCPDRAAQPPGDDRLLAKLKAEKEREQREGPTPSPAPVAPPPADEQVNPLAEFAAKGTARRALELPANTLLAVGRVSLRLNALEVSHTVGE